jgi:protein-tyrosine phosphatase/rhodanese-related sulfurtransferase
MDSLVSLQSGKLMNFQLIFNLMQQFQNGFLKLYDIRPPAAFTENHLKSALNVFPDILTIDATHLSAIIHERDPSRLRRFCIVISHSHAHEISAKQLKKLLVDLKCKEIHLLPYVEEFMERYPYLCAKFRPVHVHSYPNEILPRFLYLGSQDHAHNAEIVDVLKITHILNCTKNSHNAFPNKVIYKRVFVEDTETEKISLYFQKAFEFVEEALDENMRGKENVVLVHCAQGVSRSATIVIMFLMRATGMSVDDAKEFVKQQRNIIEPNEGFLKELRDFDRRQKKFFRRSTHFYSGKEEQTRISNEVNLPELKKERIMKKRYTIAETEGIAEDDELFD